MLKTRNCKVKSTLINSNQFFSRCGHWDYSQEKEELINGADSSAASRSKPGATARGRWALLKEMKPNKASGPDQICDHLAAEDLLQSGVCCLLFTLCPSIQYHHSGNLPSLVLYQRRAILPVTLTTSLWHSHLQLEDWTEECGTCSHLDELKSFMRLRFLWKIFQCILTLCNLTCCDKSSFKCISSHTWLSGSSPSWQKDTTGSVSMASLTRQWLSSWAPQAL